MVLWDKAAVGFPGGDCDDVLRVACVARERAELVAKTKPRLGRGGVLRDKDPGDDLLLHGLSHTTIGAAVFHFRVRDGIGWYHSANVTRERVEGRGFIRVDESRTRSRLLRPRTDLACSFQRIGWDVANGLLRRSSTCC